ncbi:MAG: hypothetical protein ACTHJV_19080 [Rhizobiaceae bacterium]
MTPSTAQAMYRRQFDMHGRKVTITRPGADPLQNVRVRITTFTPEEIAGGVAVGNRKVIVLAEDVPDSFAPLKKGDSVLVDGKSLMFTQTPDDQTRRVGETLIAYECIVAGA